LHVQTDIRIESKSLIGYVTLPADLPPDCTFLKLLCHCHIFLPFPNKKPFRIVFLFATDVEKISTPVDHLETSKHSRFSNQPSAIQNHINFLHEQAAVQHHVSEEEFNTKNLHASKFIME
jgi:hypothetical protein